MDTDNSQKEKSVVIEGDVEKSNIIVGDNNQVTIFPRKKSQKRNTNYAVMFPLSLLGCLFGLVMVWNFMDTSSFSYMLCIFPFIVLTGVSIGWLFGGVVSQSSLNPFNSLQSSRFVLGLIGSVFGFAIGLYFMRSTCGVATNPDSPAYQACNYYSFLPVMQMLAMCVLPLTIGGLILGLIVAYIANQKKSRE